MLYHVIACYTSRFSRRREKNTRRNVDHQPFGHPREADFSDGCNSYLASSNPIPDIVGILVQAEYPDGIQMKAW